MEKLMPVVKTPLNADEALAVFKVDVLEYVEKAKLKLLVGCSKNEELKEVAKVLKGDLMQSILFKKACEWLLSKKQENRFLFKSEDLEKYILYQTAIELRRRNLESYILPLIKACNNS